MLPTLLLKLQSLFDMTFTKTPPISLIVAMDKNGVIGNKGKLPWRLKNDLRYFKEKTLHKAVIMGRKTALSIRAPLPKRCNIVVTRNPHFYLEGMYTVSCLDQAIEKAIAACPDAEDIMIIGGAQLYHCAINRVERLYITHIEEEFEGDTYFSTDLERDWKIVDRTIIEKSSVHQYRHSFCMYERSIVEPLK